MAGVTALCAREPLVAYNMNLDTDKVEIAADIAKKVCHIRSGFRYCKGIGVELKDGGIVQVSMIMTNYKKISLYRIYETIRREIARYGVNVVGSEIVCLERTEALIGSLAYYLGLEIFFYGSGP